MIQFTFFHVAMKSASPAAAEDWIRLVFFWVGLYNIRYYWTTRVFDFNFWIPENINIVGAAMA